MWVIYESGNYFLCIYVYVCSLSAFYNVSKANMDCFGIKNNFSTSKRSSNALFPHKSFPEISSSCFSILPVSILCCLNFSLG